MQNFLIGPYAPGPAGESVGIYQGDALTMLREMPDNSVQCVMTSPPYWGLRDYATASWEGGDSTCQHTERIMHSTKGSTLRAGGSKKETEKVVNQRIPYRDICRKCGAIRVDKQLGLEPTPELYVEHLVAVFREVRRVLRRDGTCWLVIGDSYWGGKGKSGYELPHEAEERRSRGETFQTGHNVPGYVDMRPSNGKHPVIKPKDLCGIPWMTAFALRADGWWLRSDVIWAKPNPMPESVTDRPTRSHEYIFLLTKAARYYWDAEAIKERAVVGCLDSDFIPKSIKDMSDISLLKSSATAASVYGRTGKRIETRNVRSVWAIPTYSYGGAHFATYPPALVEKCLRAGTSEKGCCPKCGAAWQRIITKGTTAHDGSTASGYAEGTAANRLALLRQAAREWGGEYVNETRTIGWQTRCICNAGDPVPCLVLDPFMGAGTTGLVAARLGLHYIGFDLNSEYVMMARRRIIDDAPMFAGGTETNGED